MKKILILFLLFTNSIWADDAVDIESYNSDGSVFQKIADLEQEKVLMQLEKEKAQLQLDLDRLNAEKTRLAREQDNADARAAEQSLEIEKQKQALEEEKAKLEQQKQELADQAAKAAAVQDEATESAQNTPAEDTVKPQNETALQPIADKYFLVEIVGAGNQLVATLQNTENGRTKKVSVGKDVDGYNVEAISLDDGVELQKDGDVIILSSGNATAAN